MYVNTVQVELHCKMLYIDYQYVCTNVINRILATFKTWRKSSLMMAQ